MTPILGLHHVTATADDAQEDLDFAAGALGLRLVKKTVNFDNRHVYHFYYGDERGTPGTIWTTFPYKGWGVRPGIKGAGQVTATSFSVPADSLAYWRERLSTRGLMVDDGGVRFGERVLTAVDPSGLAMEVVATERDDRAPWTAAGVDPGTAIRGLHSVTMTIASPQATIDFMTSVLGYEVVSEGGGRFRLAVHGDAPGRAIDILDAPKAPTAVNGLGTVHHVAMAVPTSEDQLRLRQTLVDMGLRVTQVMDRQYFQSIYFREPGGVLFEIATTAPGFLVDEPITALGATLKLPPWEEANRPTIETGLPRVVRP